MNKRTSILLSTTMASIATAACAFCMAQSANAADASTSTSTSSVNASTVSSVDGVTSEKVSKDDSSTTQNLKSEDSSSANGGGSAFAKGSANEVKTAEPKDTAEPKNTEEQGRAADSATTVQSTAIYAATTSPASSQSQTSTQQNAQRNSPASNNTTAEQDDTTWTREDFNITPDGKQIGYRKLVKTPTGNVDKIIKGLNEKGLAKLKKNPHIVIPEGIEVIGEVAFTGNTTKVGEETKHIDGEQYIESVTLPQSLKIIGYGAFGWNKIKGTVVIPKNVISIQNGAFHANEIQKVVFDGKIDGKDKLNKEDKKEYYLAGILKYAFSRNKISEIDFANKTSDYELLPIDGLSNDMKEMPFFGQEFEIKVRVGDEFKNPLIIKQNVKKPETIYSYGGFVTSKDSQNYVLAEKTGYFNKTKDGKIIASKPGTLYGAWMLCDSHAGFTPARPIINANFTYKILPKIDTVTFVDGSNSKYAVRQVENGYTMKSDSLTDQSMPDNPTKSGYTFNGWLMRQDGKVTQFTGDTTVNGDISVYSSYTPKPPTPPAPTPEPEPEPEPTPEPEPEPDIDWDDIPDIDLTPETDFPVKPDESSTIYVPFMVDNAVVSASQQESDQCSSEPKSVEVSTKQEQSYAPVQQKRPESKRVSAKSHRLSKTGSTATPIIASAIASLFAGFAGLAESFALTRKRRN